MNDFPNHWFPLQRSHLVQFQCEVSCIRDGMTIVQVILSHEYCWFQGYRHEHSPYQEKFFVVFCDIHRRSFLSFPHLIIHPVEEWSGSHWHFWFCFVVSNDELLWPCFSLRVHNGLPRSIKRFFLFYRNVLGLHMKETWLGLVCLSPRSYNGLPRSIIHRLMRRPSFVIIPPWVACWLHVTVDNTSPRSIIFSAFALRGSDFHSFSSPGFLTPKKTEPCNKAHHWPRLRCDSFFTWILLYSFCHCSRANCRTEMANIKQAQQIISIRHVWNFLRSKCQRVGFWCRCIWFGPWNPD